MLPQEWEAIRTIAYVYLMGNRKTQEIHMDCDFILWGVEAVVLEDLETRLMKWWHWMFCLVDNLLVMIVTFIGVSEWEELVNKMYLSYHLCCSDMTNPNIGRHYSKVIVYSVCMNLQVDFVWVVSSFVWTITSILTKIGPEDQTKGQDCQL